MNFSKKNHELNKNNRNLVSKKLYLIIFVLIGIQNITAQSEDALIRETLNKYITGSTGGQPQLLKEAFHPSLNLYYVKENKVAIWSGTAYIKDTKEGQPTGESGKILSIDYTNDAAVAKVEIAHPKSKTLYIDYFLLLKTNGKWTIIHKMFTEQVKK